jgi:isoaspartyl peptidase/L-asparaginase-like protein (Ntn-hydrolase superfamily)
VANVQRFGHPVSIARAVMEHTPHMLLVGAEADAFAAEHGFEPEELLTPESKSQYERWRKENPERRAGGPMRNIEESSMGLRGRDAAHLHRARNDMHDTIGVLAIDSHGVLAGCCTTSGMPFKVPGRVGDSPIIGHGLYVDPDHGAATATGHGELVMGVCGSFLAVEAMRRGASPLDAAIEVLDRVIKSFNLDPEDQLGVITLNKQGQWSGASLHNGFSIAVKSGSRDELVDSPRVMLAD